MSSWFRCFLLFHSCYLACISCLSFLTCFSSVCLAFVSVIEKVVPKPGPPGFGTTYFNKILHHVLISVSLHAYLLIVFASPSFLMFFSLLSSISFASARFCAGSYVPGVLWIVCFRLILAKWIYCIFFFLFVVFVSPFMSVFTFSLVFVKSPVDRCN